MTAEAGRLIGSGGVGERHATRRRGGWCWAQLVRRLPFQASRGTPGCGGPARRCIGSCGGADTQTHFTCHFYPLSLAREIGYSMASVVMRATATVHIPATHTALTESAIGATTFHSGRETVHGASTPE